MEKIVSIIKGLFKFIVVVFIGLAILATIYYGIDFAFKDLLPFISRAVLANFVVFAGIIAWVSAKQIRPLKAIEEAQVVVKDSIVESETAKVQSEERLSSIEDAVANIEHEINAIIEKSEENAKLVGEKIIDDAKKTALIIQENSGKALENSRMILKNELLKRASLASVEVARNHIVNELSWNQGLHDKLIEESIEALDGITQGVNQGVNIEVN